MDSSERPECPFKDWTLYCCIRWENLDELEVTKVVYAADLFRQLFNTPSFIVYDLSISHCIDVDYQLLDALTTREQHLIQFAENSPELFLAVLSHVAHLLILPSEENNRTPILPFNSTLINNTSSGTVEFDEYPNQIVIRMVNYPTITELRDIKSGCIDKMLSVKGTVVRVSNTKPTLVWVNVLCSKCNANWRTKCSDGVPPMPKRCISKQCLSSIFTLEKEGAVMADWQRIRIQELGENAAAGRVPITKDVEVTSDEVDRCVPGDVVTIIGIVRAVSESETRGIGNRGVGRGGIAQNRFQKKFKGGNNKKGSKSGDSTDMDVDEPVTPGATVQTNNKAKAPIYNTFIEAVSIQNSRSTTNLERNGVPDLNNQDLSGLSINELYGVLSIANHACPFALICASLCPTIYGHEYVKAGIVLALLGGAPKTTGESISSVSLRSDVHVLIVGDPGLGKSQILVSVAKLAPRGIYVCGTYASTSGLTVSIHKEANHDYALEAGALVLANNGTACIDELDKMPHDVDALLEAMEQQQISVAKAGIVCNLPARTSIIAAANPKHGHYDKSKTIAQNLNTSAALLSRFDLIFVLLDKPDSGHDDLVSDHILAQHSATALDSSSKQSLYKEFTIDTEQMPQISDNDKMGSDVVPITLLERLKNFDAHNQGVLPPNLLNKYIAYAKKYVEPKLSVPAKLVLRDFYLSLRKSYQGQDSLPVTTRQLESLIRLAEARAKAELRTEVTEQDAREVIEIMKSSLSDVMEANPTIKPVGRGKQAQKHLFISELQKLSRASGNPRYTSQELYEIAQRLKIVHSSSFEEWLEAINQDGFLLREKSRQWKLWSY